MSRLSLARPLAAASLAGVGVAAAYYYCAKIARKSGRAACPDSLDAVLEFWLDPTLEDEELYHQRWFVAAGSAAQSALDAEIRTRFGRLLADAECGRVGVPSSARTCLAMIVLLDQLSRHAHRSDRARVDANDVLALRLTRDLLARGWDASLSAVQLVFALMPLRHQPTEARLQEVLEITAPRLAECESGTRLLQRFRKHTHTRLLHLEGKQGDPDDILEKEDRERDVDQSGAPTDPLSRCVDDFLRQHCGAVPTIATAAGGGPKGVRGTGHASGGRRDQKSKRRQQLLQKVSTGGGGVDGGGSADCGGSAGATHGGNGDGNHGDGNNGDGNHGDGNHGDGGSGHAAASGDSPTPLIVSLSGGVDSMVLVHTLLALRSYHGYRYSVHAVHIDYSNRAESAAEAAFVQQWCEQRGVGLRIRVVEEVTRGITARDEYEKRSREIRFAEYAALMAETGAAGVFFGHHEGDLHENVVSNVMKGAQLLDIAGIAPYARRQGSHTQGLTSPRAHIPKEWPRRAAVTRR